MLATEFISIYVSHAYGAETLGKYRSVYDVLNKIWFVRPSTRCWSIQKFANGWPIHKKKRGFRDMMSYLNLGKCADLRRAHALGARLLSFLAQWFPPLQDAAPFAAGLLAGICMSGHVRLGYEFLQAQKDAGAALLINLLSLGTGAATLFAFHGTKPGKSAGPGWRLNCWPS